MTNDEDNHNMTTRTQHDDEDNHHRMMTGMGTGMDRQRWQQCMMRGMTRTGQEWKLQATDTALYDEEHKKGPTRH